MMTLTNKIVCTISPRYLFSPYDYKQILSNVTVKINSIMYFFHDFDAIRNVFSNPSKFDKILLVNDALSRRNRLVIQRK